MSNDNNDLSEEERIRGTFKQHLDLQAQVDDFRNAYETVEFAQEQLTPLQELMAALVGTLVGSRTTTHALLADYVSRLHAGEDMGGVLDPLRSILGRDDARAGKPPEAPDVGYLSGYCDGMIEKDTTVTP